MFDSLTNAIEDAKKSIEYEQREIKKRNEYNAKALKQYKEDIIKKNGKFTKDDEAEFYDTEYFSNDKSLETIAKLNDELKEHEQILAWLVKNKMNQPTKKIDVEFEKNNVPITTLKIGDMFTVTNDKTITNNQVYTSSNVPLNTREYYTLGGKTLTSKSTNFSCTKLFDNKVITVSILDKDGDIVKVNKLKKKKKKNLLGENIKQKQMKIKKSELKRLVFEVINESTINIGDTVKVNQGSGLDSGKTGKVIPPKMIKTDGRGIPLDISGAYKPIDWKKEVAIQLDNGEIITMFKNRIQKLN